jgi:putative two-component system response regulator
MCVDKDGTTEGAASAEQRLAALKQRVRAELAAPTSDSIVRVAAVHNELRTLVSTAPSGLLVECLLDVAQFFNVSGQTALGLDAAIKAVDVARALNDQRVLRKALTFHGILQADSGNLPSAIESYAGALELAARSQDTVGEGAVWNNVGIALLYSAQFAEAIQCFRRALTIAETSDALRPIRPLAQSNIALASLFCEEFESGLSFAQAAISELSDPTGANDLLYRVNAETHFARLLLEIGRLKEAKAHSEAAKGFASRSHSQRAALTAEIAEGLVEVYSGNIDIGLSRLQTALQQSRVMKFSLRDALIAMVKAQDAAGNPQLALVHLRELLNVTRRTQQERALVHHRMHLERLALTNSSLTFPFHALDRERVRLQLALLHRQSIAAELIEDPSGEHIFRVGKLSAILGSELGLDDDTCFMLEMSARLHDIGKIGIPEAIIAKRGKINPDQRALVQTHANIGAELLSQSGLPHIQMAVDVARHHHEKWDGSGYPDGLAMEAIPEVARIVALADSFDAMTHDRPYRKAMSVENALSEINAAAGTKFDPGMTDVFSALVLRLREEHSDLDAFLGAEAQESPFIRARKKISEALQQAKDSGGLAGV